MKHIITDNSASTRSFPRAFKTVFSLYECKCKQCRDTTLNYCPQFN